MTDTHETVIPPEILALQQIEAEKAELEALRAQVQADQAILLENRDLYIAAASAARVRVEDAKAALAEDLAALGTGSLADSLKAQLSVAADAVMASVEWEQQWVLAILDESKERMLQSINEAVAEFDGLEAWIQPRPVNEDAIRAVIERDLQTLADEQALGE